jgi:hypothetical protein
MISFRPWHDEEKGLLLAPTGTEENELFTEEV